MAQRPSAVNPYRNVRLLMGSFKVTLDGEEMDMTTGSVAPKVKERMISNMNSSSRSVSKSAGGFMSYVEKV